MTLKNEYFIKSTKLAVVEAAGSNIKNILLCLLLNTLLLLNKNELIVSETDELNQSPINISQDWR